jgi:hypothetical protein
MGTRTLASTEIFPDGQSQPHVALGPHAKGYLMYAADRQMCSSLMKPGRMLWKDDYGGIPTEKDRLDAADGFLAYCETYTVEEAKRIIFRLLEISFMPQLCRLMYEQVRVLSAADCTLRLKRRRDFTLSSCAAEQPNRSLPPANG